MITGGSSVMSERPARGRSCSTTGSLIAFRSSIDLAGVDPDDSSDLFLVNSDGTELRQPLAGTVNASGGGINGNGTVLVFWVAENQLGTNPDHNHEIFIANVDGSNLQQLTMSEGGDNLFAAVSADGSLIAFASNADLLGQTPGGGREIFTMSADGTDLSRLTDGGGDAPLISADASTIAFHSYSDLTGDNSEHVREVFVIRSDGTGLLQLTDSGWRDSGQSSISSDGSIIALISEADLTSAGTNLDKNKEVFVMNSDGSGVRQVTFTLEGESLTASISGDGSRIGFISNGDLLQGQNPDGNFELFLAVYEQEPIPTVSEWGLVVLALTLLISITIVFGRRRGAA